MQLSKSIALIMISLSLASTTSIAKSEDEYMLSAKTFEGTLKAVANKLNKDLPSVIDEDTRVDSVTALPGRILEYKYTLLSLNIKDYSKSQMKEVNKIVDNDILPYMISGLCGDENVKYFFKYNATMRYIYTSADNVLIMKKDITGKDCKNK